MEGGPQVQRSNVLTREMDAVASHVRDLLKTAINPNRFELSSPAGWTQLLEACFMETLTEGMSQESLAKVRTACLRWQHLYRELRFVAATRPVWNT